MKIKVEQAVMLEGSHLYANETKKLLQGFQLEEAVC